MAWQGNSAQRYAPAGKYMCDKFKSVGLQRNERVQSDADYTHYSNENKLKCASAEKQGSRTLIQLNTDCTEYSAIFLCRAIPKRHKFNFVHLSSEQNWHTIYWSGDESFPHADCATHRRPKNNSSDPAAFYPHTHQQCHARTQARTHTYTRCTNHTQEHAHAHKYTAEAARNSCAQ